MTVVVQWTGWEAAQLGRALRLSIREYARQLGVNQSTVQKWRKRGRGIELRGETAEILDAMLRRCDDEELATFRAALASDGQLSLDDAGLGIALGPLRVISHKFVPVYIGEAVQALFETAKGCPVGPGGLKHRAVPADHPEASPESQLYLYACGVAIFHLIQPLKVSSLGELAAWRYQSYVTDLDWATSELQRLLTTEDSASEAAATYVLSAYLLEDSPWEGQHLETALQVLTTPSVVVDREHPAGARRLGDEVERALFVEGYTQPDTVDFGMQAVSLGLASWSGVTYHPLALERALPMDAIVALELDVQTLWALSTYVLDEVEAARDPVMPDEAYGWRWLRGAYSRLTAARPQETAQHQLMREAVLATSQLPDRLHAAQEALRESSL
ncbi:XRE family transcriptional regulator [Streptomyces mirabilis]|uniref:XRE family transcriptional regulator n=1 Tax=Streptomyces mirabilis TaxID=68239 RepID=UPI0033E731FC